MAVAPGRAESAGSGNRPSPEVRWHVLARRHTAGHRRCSTAQLHSAALSARVPGDGNQLCVTKHKPNSCGGGLIPVTLCRASVFLRP